MEATNEPNTRAVEPYLKLTILTVWFDLHTGDALTPSGSFLKKKEFTGGKVVIYKDFRLFKILVVRKGRIFMFLD